MTLSDLCPKCRLAAAPKRATEAVTLINTFTGHEGKVDEVPEAFVLDSAFTKYRPEFISARSISERRGAVS
jgi:hypothetical protein